MANYQAPNGTYPILVRDRFLALTRSPTPEAYVLDNERTEEVYAALLSAAYGPVVTENGEQWLRVSPRQVRLPGWSVRLYAAHIRALTTFGFYRRADGNGVAWLRLRCRDLVSAR